MPTNDPKRRIRNAYEEGKPIRVPVSLGANPRVWVLDPKWNTGGVTFEEYFTDAAAVIEAQLGFMEYRARFLNHYCDDPVGRPEGLEFHVDNLNSYDAMYFGAPAVFRDGQVPDTEPILAGRDKDRIFKLDIDRPMDNPFICDVLRRHEDLTEAVGSLSYHGMTFTVQPPLLGFDGELTIATALRGTELYGDFYEDPPYVRRLMEFIQRAVIVRNRAVAERFGRTAFEGKRGGHADDSVQLISTEMYAEFVLPLHRKWYALWSVEGPHSMHLCGDATRHFPLIRRELNVLTFDTGFPVDHGRLRRVLGPEVTIQGGPEVALLLNGTPQQVHRRTRDILQSGVMEGGRFLLREANNLPPCCPAANLQAMYECCLEHGSY
ncbi:MAG TPA: uroporphyrinogen decarboxylase family protein [Phycisphaerae bacterium]|nr:uroporphyrinogen decarboxylase family protein [Phycisphaerae bacterium]